MSIVTLVTRTLAPPHTYVFKRNLSFGNGRLPQKSVNTLIVGSPNKCLVTTLSSWGSRIVFTGPQRIRYGVFVPDARSV